MSETAKQPSPRRPPGNYAPGPSERVLRSPATDLAGQGSTVNENFTQRLSKNGALLVSKKGWVMRVVVLEAMLVLLLYNFTLFRTFPANVPFTVYVSLMQGDSLLAFLVGWLFFRSRADGQVPDDLVSVLVPIYNQRALIKQVIDAIFRSTYSNVEVVAVNDGSKDGTREVLDSLAQEYPNLKVIHKENGGKRSAVAAAFYASRGKYIVLIDSDSVVDEYAIEEFMKAFTSNPGVGGLVGHGKVLNAPKNWITKMQDAWYDYAFNIRKTTESTVGTVLCCSGCLAAYRREVIAPYIPYWSRITVPNSDDRDLTVYAISPPRSKSKLASSISRSLKMSIAQQDDSAASALNSQALDEWKTMYVPTAIVETEVPQTLRGFLRQQTRWKLGVLRSNFFATKFMWKKNPIISIIFYTEYFMTFVSWVVNPIIYLYEPLFAQNFSFAVANFTGVLLLGVAGGLDYYFRDSKARYWMYKPLMNVFASMVLPWLIFPVLRNFKRNRWLTR